MFKKFFILIIIISFSSVVYAFDFTSAEITGDTGWAWGVDSGDVDGDGDMDILVANASGGNKLWLNDGSANFTEHPIAGFGNAYGALFMDIDGDGNMDIVMSYVGGNSLRAFINDGSLNFTSQVIISASKALYNPIFADVDGDTDLDIYVTDQSGARPNLLLINDGSGLFTESNIITDTAATISSVFIDVDGDGDLDIYAPSFGTSQNKLWINDGLGNGGASFTASDIVGDIGSSYMTRAADVNDDSFIDIYTTVSSGQNKLWINDGLGNGGASFTAADIVGDEFASEGFFADFNDDGFVDLYSSIYGFQTHLWINDGLGNGGTSFSDDPIVGDVFDVLGVTVNDFDGDGYLDIYLGVYAGGQNKLWINGYSPPASSSGSSSKKRSSLKRICSDPKASNYNPTRFGRNWPSFCKYDKPVQTCDQSLKKYWKIGDNAADIYDIQNFLKTELQINISVDGVFGQETKHAVQQFQNKYYQDILAPWSLPIASGNWYQSTRKKANEILGCEETSLVLDNGFILE